MKIAIATLYDSHYTALADVINPNKQEYCHRYGYDYRILNDIKDYGFDKLKFILQLFAEGYDVVMWQDLDTIITNMTIPVTLPYNGADIVMSRHEEHYLHPTDTNPFGEHLNAGTFIIKNTPFTQWFLQYILTRPYDHGNEQDYFNRFQTIFSREIYPMPQRFMNSFPVQRGITFKDDKDGNWQPGDWIVHMSGMLHDKRIEITPYYLDRIIK